MWELACVTACQLPHIYQTPHDRTVGAGLPAMTAYLPILLSLTPHNLTVGAGLLAKAA